MTLASISPLCRSGHCLSTVEGIALPLHSVALRVGILETSMRSTLVQEWRNATDASIEALYTFPLDESAALFELRYAVDGQETTAVSMPLKKAERRYEDAVSEGRGAVLLERLSDDQYSISVGQILPGQEVRVTLSYVQVLRRVDNAAEVFIPFSLGERYFPAPMDPFSAARVNPELVSSFHAPFTLDVSAEGSDISRISLHGFPVSAAAGPGKSALHYESKTLPDGDVSIRVAYATEEAAAAWYGEHASGRKAILTRFTPLFESDAALPAEVMILLDCSGSMGGERIESAKKALSQLLQQLDEGSRVGIFLFGSDCRHISRSSSMRLTPQVLASLQKEIADIDADMGGTEILGALEIVAAVPLTAEYQRSVILISDGEVGNIDEVIALAHTRFKGSRIFSFGIGSGASHALLSGVARATGGACEMLPDEADLAARVLRQASRLGDPLASDIRIAATGCNLELVNSVPSLFSEETACLFAELAEGPCPETLTVSARVNGADVHWEVPVRRADADTPVLLWGREAIRTAEMVDTDVPAAITQLACDLNLPSRSTSMVAVSIADALAPSLPNQINVPGVASRDRMPSAMMSAMPLMCEASCCMDLVSYDMDVDIPLSRSRSCKADVAHARPAPKKSKAPSAQTLAALLTACQQPDGHFEISPELMQALLALWPDIYELLEVAEEHLAAQGLASPDMICHTAMVLAIISAKLSALKQKPLIPILAGAQTFLSNQLGADIAAELINTLSVELQETVLP